MLIQSKTGNIDSIDLAGRTIDWLPLEWYETGKRILRKRTQSGREVSLKFMKENPTLMQGDILFKDEQSVIAVDILSCDCLVIFPANMFQVASICYEIGNKHLPLYFENDVLLVPFEQPLFRLLVAQGYSVKAERRKLLQPLKTTVTPHGNTESLFSKIMKLTHANE